MDTKSIPPHFVTYTLPSHNPPNTQTLPTVSTTKDLWIVLNTRLSVEDNFVSAANKARRVLFYLKRSFAARTPSIFLLLYKTFIRPHLEYSIQATHPILCRDAEALEKIQKLALKFVKRLRHVPYEAALKQLRLFSLTHRRIRGDLIAMFKITHSLLEFPMASTFVYPTRKGYAATHSSSTNSDTVRAVANSLYPFGLSHFGTNWRLR